MAPIKGASLNSTAVCHFWSVVRYISTHLRNSSGIMSLRQLCKETGRQPSKALFYFPDERKTGIAPTRVISDDGVFSVGRIVTVDWAGEKVRAEILALSGK